jgi:hypothetical protein
LQSSKPALAVVNAQAIYEVNCTARQRNEGPSGIYRDPEWHCDAHAEVTHHKGKPLPVAQTCRNPEIYHAKEHPNQCDKGTGEREHSDR